MSAQPVRRSTHRSTRMLCPEHYCGKLWSPSKADAKVLRAEIERETGDGSPVRYYEHAGGWHWTSRTNKKDM